MTGITLPGSGRARVPTQALVPRPFLISCLCCLYLDLSSLLAWHVGFWGGRFGWCGGGWGCSVLFQVSLFLNRSQHVSLNLAQEGRSDLGRDSRELNWTKPVHPSEPLFPHPMTPSGCSLQDVFWGG